MITITKGSESLKYLSWDFSDGSIGIRLDTDNHRYRLLNRTSRDLAGGLLDTPLGHQTITARIHGPKDIVELVMVTDALRRWDSTPISLVLPYMPYSRQDRVCCIGEAHSLRAFSRLINDLDYQRVTTFDPHSDVAGAVFDNLTIIDQATVIGRFSELNKAILTDPAKTIFVAPDAGAIKKTTALANLYNHRRFIRGDKTRELSTGRILSTEVYGDVTGLICVIIDDLIDGGASFVELAKVLVSKGAAQVILFVTHGIFSKGIERLFEAGIDHVYTTNSYRTDYPDDINLTVLDLGRAFSLGAQYLKEEEYEEGAEPWRLPTEKPDDYVRVWSQSQPGGIATKTEELNPPVTLLIPGDGSARPFIPRPNSIPRTPIKS